MTPKAEFFGRIEDYCLEQLSDLEKLEFEVELKNNVELQEELNFQREILNAISEKDILNLRDKLESVVKKSNGNGRTNGSFEMLDEFTDIEEISENIPAEELISYFDSLPKVHVAQHELTSNENIHHFYKEQNKSEVNGEEESLNGFDFEDIEGLDDAIMENDIMHLRDTLIQVSQSVTQSFSIEDIDDYVNGNLTNEKLEEFEQEMKLNSVLRDEIKLHREMELALSERDVLDLRYQLANIMETETSWKVSERNIEDFIEGLLEEADLEEFNNEYKENFDLKSEVNLRSDVNFAIGEKEIFELRNQLKIAREKATNTEIKSLFPEAGLKIQSYWKQSVAVIILLIGLTGVLSVDYNSGDTIYDSFYETAQIAPERSIDSETNAITIAKEFYSVNDWVNTIVICDEAIENENDKYVFQFLKGSSLQNLEKYNEAIVQFNKVIAQNDNILIEEAEWYKSLAYIKLGDNEQAKKQLIAIVARNSFYENEAKAVLRRLKYAVK